jgi:hypothetical protein
MSHTVLAFRPEEDLRLETKLVHTVDDKARARGAVALAVRSALKSREA